MTDRPLYRIQGIHIYCAHPVILEILDEFTCQNPMCGKVFKPIDVVTYDGGDSWVPRENSPS